MKITYKGVGLCALWVVALYVFGAICRYAMMNPHLTQTQLLFKLWDALLLR